MEHINAARMEVLVVSNTLSLLFFMTYFLSFHCINSKIFLELSDPRVSLVLQI